MQAMQTTVTWTGEGLGFDCAMSTGETCHLAGDKTALSPMQAVLMAVGACSSVDVIEIMRKARYPLSYCECIVTGTRADSAPMVFTHITAEYRVKAPQMHQKHLNRAVELSTKKYCSVMLMLDKSVDFEIKISIL